MLTVCLRITQMMLLLILNKMPFLCLLHLKYSVLFFSLLLLHFTFVSQGFYVGSEQFHIKHTPLITTVSQLSIWVCYNTFI